MPAPSPPPLHETLLAAPPVPSERAPDRRWAYGLAPTLLATAFLLYHTTVLLVWNTPHKGLLKQFHSTYLKQVKGYEYFKGTRQTQSWGMFAPNPNRTNVFIQVFVEDQDGELWDFEQDIWAEDRYPYIWYDRRGKVNRNLDGKKHYQRIYGAWACREWERIHAGEAPKSVTFIKRWTRVPNHRDIIAQGGWDQWAAESIQKEQETITCKTVVHGTLPNELRERYGLPLIDEDQDFRPVVSRSWWDKAERQRQIDERKAAREARIERERGDEDDAPADEDSPDQ